MHLLCLQEHCTTPSNVGHAGLDIVATGRLVRLTAFWRRTRQEVIVSKSLFTLP